MSKPPFWSLTLIILLASPLPGAVLCVDDDNATGVEEGSALRPFRTLQAAVDAAAAGDQIRVAAGTYLQNVLVENKALELLGGFPGGTATGYATGTAGNFATRDPLANLSTLQGDGTAAVLRFRKTAAVAGATVVDGFRVTGGRRGLHLDGEYPSGDFADFTFAHNLIEGNGYHDPGWNHRGGGIYAEGTDVAVLDNVIRDNTADTGAGIAGSVAGWLIQGNLVEGNVGASDHGGGLWLAGTGAVTGNVIRGNRIGELVGYGWAGGMLTVGVMTISGNLITGNYAPTLGGGVFVDEGAEAWLDHNLVVGNSTSEAWVKGGAGIYVDAAWDGTPSLAHISSCTIAGNTSPGSNGGNGVYVEHSVVDVVDSIFWGNSLGDDFYLDADSTLTVSYCLSQEPIAGGGNLSLDPLFADPAGGDYHLKSSGGRWDPVAQAWVSDPVDSPGVDAGDPSSPFGNEPEPNGDRVNLGFDGNTAEASRSPGEGALFADGFESATTAAWSATAPFAEDAPPPRHPRRPGGSGP